MSVHSQSEELQPATRVPVDSVEWFDSLSPVNVRRLVLASLFVFWGMLVSISWIVWGQ